MLNIETFIVTSLFALYSPEHIQYTHVLKSELQ